MTIIKPPAVHHANASLAGRYFRLNPTSVKWAFKSKVSDINTLGGKVVQIFGTTTTDLTIEGTFGVGGWQEQAEFLEWMRAVASRQIEDLNKAHAIHKNPPRFRYPAKGWDFLVYLKEYSSPDGNMAVVLDNEIIAPRWRLTLFVVEDNSKIKRIAQDSYLSRIALGIGWKQTKYNGPLDPNALQDVLDGLTPEQYLEDEYGLGDDVPSGDHDPNNPPDPTPIPDPGGGGTNSSNKALGKQMASDLFGWTGQQWEDLLTLWTHESGWNHEADNPTSSAYGIPQALVSAHFPLPANYYDSYTGSPQDSTFHGHGGSPSVQIRWGLNYIKDVYGDPSGAWAFWQAHNYY